ncbi:MAG TPA: epoxyqueuosine reductase QueH [Clostridiaceae bacterium]|nr:epoxyqueuosine reductase QueH [Clostridiaceae bacterium]
MRLLLHICCAPCAVAVAETLMGRPGMELEGFFYNPNIHPTEEFNKRKDTVKRMSEDLGLPVFFDDENRLDLWKHDLENKDKSIRCRTCYAIRLEKIAQFTKMNGFDGFTTSLLISPYQNHDLIREMGSRAAEKYGLSFHYEDFRNLYRKGREISRARNYYMQKYCGCIFSYGESDHPKKPIYIFEQDFEKNL